MRIGVLGTGIVGTTLATKLVELGNEVKMGSRNADNKAANEWAEKAGKNATTGTFEDAARFGDMVIVAVKGSAALDVLKMAKPENLSGKTIIDTCNPLDFSAGFLKLTVCNTDSLAEQLQRAMPDANIVNTLNTVSSVQMTDHEKLDENLTIFVCGNSDKAKGEASEMLKWFGWNDIIDLGDITAARCTEMMLPLWVRMYSKWNDPYVSFRVFRKKQ